jgi:ABC-type Fe3+-hydroxamate transport system substrate-binding protein
MNWGEFVDEVGRAVRIAAPPSRVVSLVPSLTETLYDLGAGERVVGVSDWCGPAVPEGAAPVRVGGVCNPRIQTVLDLEPELVLVSREENSLDDVRRLEREDVPVFAVNPRDVTDAARTVRNLGRLLGLDERASALAQSIDEGRTRVVDRAETLEPISAVMPIWKDPWMTVGPGTYPASLMEDVGVRLVGLQTFSQYPRLSLERAANARPTLVLLPDEPYDFHGEAGRELLCELGRRCNALPRAVRLDGRMVAWYGSRSGDRLAELARQVRPELQEP